MKSSILLVLLSFLSISILPNPSLGAPQPLLDISGDEIVTGTEYYIVSAITGAGGGGLNLFFGRNKPCPMDVYQEPLDLLRGRPLLFFPVNYTGEEGDIVYESTDMNIQFNIQSPICPGKTTVWKVDNYDDEQNAWFITTNGVVGNPGPKTQQNWFKFEKIGFMYKIVHCPSVCMSSEKLCSAVGIHFDARRRLALNDDRPFPLVFLKASDVDKVRERFTAVI